LTGETRQFTATVANSTQGVTWSATGGSVDQNGLYTAPQTPGTHTVTARSVEDPTKSASATVTVTADVGGTYQGTHQDFDFGECSHDENGTCIDKPAAAVLEVSGSSFTLYYFENGSVGDTATCGDNFNLCIRYTGTISGSSLTGTGVRDVGNPRYENLPFSATVSGSTMTGQGFWDNGCPGGCYYDFTLTK